MMTRDEIVSKIAWALYRADVSSAVVYPSQLFRFHYLSRAETVFDDLMVSGLLNLDVPSPPRALPNALIQTPRLGR